MVELVPKHILYNNICNNSILCKYKVVNMSAALYRHMGFSINENQNIRSQLINKAKNSFTTQRF